MQNFFIREYHLQVLATKCWSPAEEYDVIIIKIERWLKSQLTIYIIGYTAEKV